MAMSAIQLAIRHAPFWSDGHREAAARILAERPNAATRQKTQRLQHVRLRLTNPPLRAEKAVVLAP
jgi:hypothetical protein